jgi:hypothetical protein
VVPTRPTTILLLLPLASCQGPGAEVQAAPDEVVVDGEWLPLPVFLVPSLPPRNHKHNVGWNRREIERRVVEHPDGVEVWLSDSNGYSAAPLGLWFGVGPDGALTARSSGRRSSCMSRGDFFDVHGPLLVDESLWSTGVVRFAFTLDAIDDDLLNPLRMEGSSQADVDLAGWAGEVRLARNRHAGDPAGPARHLATWLWADGSLRARGEVDDLGRRQGLWSTYTRAGGPQSITEFVDGAREGSWESWYKGVCHTTGTLAGGARVGEWITVLPDGTRSIETYR